MTLQQELRLALADVAVWEKQFHYASEKGPGIDYGWLRVHVCEAHLNAALARQAEINRLIAEESRNEGK